MRSGGLKDALDTQLSSAHRIVTIRQREKIIFQKRVPPPNMAYLGGGRSPFPKWPRHAEEKFQDILEILLKILNRKILKNMNFAYK